MLKYGVMRLMCSVRVCWCVDGAWTVESARAVSVYVGGFLSVRVVEGQVDQEIAFARVVSHTRRPKGI